MHFHPCYNYLSELSGFNFAIPVRTLIPFLQTLLPANQLRQHASLKDYFIFSHSTSDCAALIKEVEHEFLKITDGAKETF